MPADELCIQVQDTGIGMTPEECQRLFKDFSRIKNEKTRRILGSGLGTVHAQKSDNAVSGECNRGKPA
jgi:two-component system, sensor histidine kinase and response regulator